MESRSSKYLSELLGNQPVRQSGKMRAILYSADSLEEVELKDINELIPLRERAPVLWLDVDGPCDTDLLGRIGEMFNLHPLALEDVASTHQRAKVEEYSDHHFIVLRMVELSQEGKLQTEQLSAFVSKKFVITFQEKPGGDCLDPVRNRIRRKQGRIRDLGADHLAYAILDAVIDAYFPVIEKIEDRLEDLEEELDSGNQSRAPSPSVVRRAHVIRREIQKLRHAAMPIRDVVHKLSQNVRNVSDETRIHLRDCYDHVLRILELIETHRDTCLGVRELYQSRLSNHTNDVMKILAIITTLFTPLTFIAGVYGMNFNPDKSPLNMPELNWHYGYPFAIGLMIVVFIGMLYYLFRKGWLGRSAQSRDENDDNDHSS